ncbi:sensor histidine kinase [Conyzicola nivalis]|uniref:histidine kinase n=1 Tax=Conyzicola nivalis TaxID=1477021 RepID=A0A916WHW0_9MICO|nr:sensor domain-containing protein [Conyzicola nivalis]GGA99315.1 histidine kinase [Conyzicola nivalis]
MTSTDRAATARTTYLSLWRTVPRELGFLALTLPVAVIGFSTVITLFFAGIGTIPVFLVGFAVLVGALYVSRFFGELELIRLGWAGRPAITRPLWTEAVRGGGFWKWLGSVLGGAHYWLYLLHTMVVNFAVSLATWIVTVIWVSVTFSAVTFWFWQLALPDRGGEWYVTSRLFEGLPEGVGRDVLEAAVVFVIGVVMLAALPFVTRGLVLLHDVIARVTLGAFPSEALRARVGNLEASRGAAISAEGHSLRRLERDIHDGPQQRLVRLQMDLAAADRQLDTDPVRARQLIAEAMAQSKDALEELRALSRGFAPPILLDRGLIAALESAAVRSDVPVRVTSGLPEGFDLPQEIERNAYFVASEALANAAKHAAASAVEVSVAVRRVLETDDTWLDVSVTDDGRGGAAEVAGHGLAGLDERLRGLGGTLELDSPVGGPTVLTAHLPLASSYPASTVTPPTLGV